MIFSMTGYARGECKDVWGSACWEIRSVNQRYLENYVRLPEAFRGLEPIIRERCRKKLARGKVECQLRFDANNDAASELKVNMQLAKQVVDVAQSIMALSGDTSRINPLQVMNWPGVMQVPEQDVDAISAKLLASFDACLLEFIAARTREGKVISDLLEQRLAAIDAQIIVVRDKMPQILQWQRTRLLSKFAEAQIELEPQRLEQELVLLAQKSDVAEELDRLSLHVAETRNILQKGGVCGRKLDFMMQEFNRETNTLGSKSIDPEITAAVVELKVLIEQMREQIQNVE
ncbi:MAG: YicC/YloC family endoribonuclease [Vibrionaceae bacterium]